MRPMHPLVAGLVCGCAWTVASQNAVYDVVVIGSGPGGLVAAEYLSRDPTISVLVLEAGPPSLQASGGTDVAQEAAGTGLTRFDIPGEYTDVAFQPANTYRPDWIASPKTYVGMVVGGSSSLNGMLFFYPPDAYVAETSWPNSVADVNGGFTEIQKHFTWTDTPSTDKKRYLQDAYNILATAFSSGGYAEVDNINTSRNAKTKTFGHPPFAIQDGMRASPAKTFYSNMKARPNVKVLTMALVDHIVHTAGQASGVTYTVQGHTTTTAALSRRGAVILAAGALSTPKVLIQSGIGPASQLAIAAAQSFRGVPTDKAMWVVNDNVGRHLFDTTGVQASFSHPNMTAFFHGGAGAAVVGQYLTSKSGPYASPDPVFVGYDSAVVRGRTYQFQVTGFCHGFNGAGAHDFGIAVYLNNPLSRDAVGFTPDGRWHGDLNQSGYFSAPGDAEALSTYVASVVGMFEAQGVGRVAPTAADDVKAWVLQHKGGTNHYGGSCYTSVDATDANRCADATFKVVGTANVFVADASLMKEGTVNPYGFVMYAGHQAGVNVQAFLTSSTASTAPQPTTTSVGSTGPLNATTESPTATSVDGSASPKTPSPATTTATVRSASPLHAMSCWAFLIGLVGLLW
ncbi:Aste57867_13712 [Aphanomyces stellatus]|uniref:Aste57867_13712 protein n=1 Tax=Aphanomyces stellatus TaxID=120398 RepID=A0A485KYU1_9STRA|nr:hypothetical protein As57867_013662 [Aphanomyces stellatus]VFT90545.1 Aste57867_13712 [Aphanomyces stellatus]